MSDINKPPFASMPESKPMPRNEPGSKHRRWIVHSHEAFRPAHVEATSDINITPLIDVMLVLLIIFMVVTPLAQRGLDIALPAPDTKQQQEQRQPGNEVVLSVEEAPGGGSVVSINKNPVANMEDLEQRLRDIYQTRSDKTIFVRGSGKVVYGRIVEAMDAARGAGVERIGIISEKMLEEAGAAPAAGAPGQ
jgi:biopolymer transport protein TolR